MSEEEKQMQMAMEASMMPAGDGAGADV